MRTTLTIADETDTRLRKLAREQNRSYKELVNDALSLGLAQLEIHEAVPLYRVEPFNAELAPGVDRQRLNQMVDEMEAGE